MNEESYREKQGQKGALARCQISCRHLGAYQKVSIMKARTGHVTFMAVAQQLLLGSSAVLIGELNKYLLKMKCAKCSTLLKGGSFPV